MLENLNGTWIRSNDGLIIRVTQQDNAAMKAYFPTESITYNFEGSLLKTNKKDKEFRGNIINEKIIQWASETEDGKLNYFLSISKNRFDLGQNLQIEKLKKLSTF